MRSTALTLILFSFFAFGGEKIYSQERPKSEPIQSKGKKKQNKQPKEPKQIPDMENPNNHSTKPKKDKEQ